LAIGLTVQLTANDKTPRARSYTAHVDPKLSAAHWQPVVLSPADFHSADGQTLPNWRDLDKIELRGVTSKQGPPRFARFHWVNAR
jgi:hypothetical protein